MNLTTRQLVAVGMLGGISIALAVSGLGFIPMPTGIMATIMHVPAILGGISQGPVAGSLVGLIFGVYAFLNPVNPMFSDPLISILPRLFIGVTSYYAYQLASRHRFAPAISAAVGSATNTIGVLGMIWLRGYLPFKAVAVVALTHGIPEIIVAAVITSVLIRALRRVMRTNAA